MKSKYLLFAFVAIAFYSCTKIDNQEKKTVSFTALSGVSDNTDTKTAIIYEDGQYKTKWVGGETVKVYKQDEMSAGSKTFTNQTIGESTSAVFTTDDFWEGGFESGVKYVITYNCAKAISPYYYLTIPATQYYDSDAEFHIQGNILPLYGGINIFGNTNKNTVRMYNASIILYLTLRNSLGTSESPVPVTIKYIELTSSVSGTRPGIAGELQAFPAGGTMMGDTFSPGSTTITLQIPEGKRPTLGYNDTASFGFVIGNTEPKILTWTAYNESNVQIGDAVSVNLTGKTLVRGNYYTISRSLTTAP